MKSRALTLAASAALFLSAMPALAATVIFDDFTVNQKVVDEPTASAPNTSTIAFGNGDRTLTVENTANNGDAEAATKFVIVGGALTFSNDQGATGIGTLTYTGVGDIANGSDPFFFFDVAPDSFDAMAEFSATATDSFGNSFVYEESLDGDFSPILYFSEFIGVDFNNLVTLSFSIESELTRVDGSLNSISISAIPLPAGGLLLIAGLGGLAALRRKKRA